MSASNWKSLRCSKRIGAASLAPVPDRLQGAPEPSVRQLERQPIERRLGPLSTA